MAYIFCQNRHYYYYIIWTLNFFDFGTQKKSSAPSRPLHGQPWLGLTITIKSPSGAEGAARKIFDFWCTILKLNYLREELEMNLGPKKFWKFWFSRSQNKAILGLFFLNFTKNCLPPPLRCIFGHKIAIFGRFIFSILELRKELVPSSPPLMASPGILPLGGCSLRALKIFYKYKL